MSSLWENFEANTAVTVTAGPPSAATAARRYLELISERYLELASLMEPLKEPSFPERYLTELSTLLGAWEDFIRLHQELITAYKPFEISDPQAESQYLNRKLKVVKDLRLKGYCQDLNQELEELMAATTPEGLEAEYQEVIDLGARAFFKGQELEELRLSFINRLPAPLRRRLVEDSEELNEEIDDQTQEE